ncbi:MAG: GTPase HflX [Chloroflexi bacterium]|nr:GTPase HflX [Chloroflexota bacterium]
MNRVAGAPKDTGADSERAFLLAVARKDARGGLEAEVTLEELAQLAETAGVRVVGKLIQRMKSPSSTHYLGKGKLEELRALKNSLGYEVAIVDDELTPRQQQNLEDALEVKIIDRPALILDIFAKRARTREGKLQVELAQYQYLLPRLAGRWSHLERLGGGIGTRGPGESQLETDKRIMRQKIHRLKEQLEQVRKQRGLYREKRRKSGVPVVSLVGYTNAGKSTLLNALTKAGAYVEDGLFSTLDPTTRQLALPDNRKVLITDTVGFIRKLPPTLVAAFRATLEELEEASVLVHVVDFTSPHAAEQHQVVEGILAELGLAEKPRITALNKIDLLLDSSKTWDEKTAIEFLSDQRAGTSEVTVLISAAKKWGLSALLEKIMASIRS